MTALLAAHAIPAPLEVIPAALVERQAAQVAQASAVVITDAATFDQANALLMELHATGKAVEARRVELKKPITQLGKLVDEIASKAADPLDAAKRSLQGKVLAYQRAEQEKAAAARRAAEEQARKEREAQDAERRRLEAEAQAKAEQEAKELAAVLGQPVAPAVVKVAPAPTPAPAPVVAVPPAPKAAAINVRTVAVLVIDDPKQIPAYLGGQELRPIDRAAVRRALDAGAVIPGARMEQQEQVAMARGRA